MIFMKPSGLGWSNVLVPPLVYEDDLMEIVPILSTIILVGTVATFILAVAAYILYKMREGGGGVPQEETTEQVQPHHVVMPVDYSTMMGQRGDSGPAEASTYFAPTATTPPHNSYIETNNGYGFGGERANGHRGQAPGLPADTQQGMSLDSFFWEYTDEGFSPLDSNAQNASVPRKPDQSSSEESQE